MIFCVWWCHIAERWNSSYKCNLEYNYVYTIQLTVYMVSVAGRRSKYKDRMDKFYEIEWDLLLNVYFFIHFRFSLFFVKIIIIDHLKLFMYLFTVELNCCCCCSSYHQIVFHLFISYFFFLFSVDFSHLYVSSGILSNILLNILLEDDAGIVSLNENWYLKTREIFQQHFSFLFF